MGKRRVTAEDLFEIHVLGDVAQHPTQHLAAVVVTRLDAEDNRERSCIWKVHTDSGEAALWTAGGNSDTQPAWSPDGRWLAFLSDRHGDQPQLYVLPLSGGEAIPVTGVATGVREFRWSPDGRSIAFTANVPEWADAVDARDKTPGEKSPRERYTADVKVIRRAWYRLDGVGYFGDRRNHLHVVDLTRLVSDRRPLASPYQTNKLDVEFPVTRLTEGPFDVDSFDWLPNMEAIIFAGNLEPDADETRNQHLYRLPLAGRGTSARAPEAVERLYGAPTFATQPAVSPDGRFVAFYGHNQEFRGYTQWNVWIYDLEERIARCLTAKLDAAFTDVSLSDMRGTQHCGLTWSEDQKHVFSLLSARGTTQLVRVDVETGACLPVTDGDACVQTYSMNQRTSSAIIVRAESTTPGALYMLEVPLGTGDRPAIRPLYDWNRAWLDTVMLASPVKCRCETPDGSVEGWVLLPPNPPPTEGYPTVVQVHGGPMAMYGEQFFLEFQCLAAAGIAVVYCNPHGSLGYGQAFCSAIQGRWGTVDFADLEAFVDAALEQFPLSHTRLAIAGGSYGGYMAAWAIGHTKRYQAAVVMRACVNEYSMFGTCDVGFEDLYDFGVTPWQAPERYLEMSPLSYADEMNVPVLILHAENDLRCPIEQAEQLYMALRIRNVPVEFVRFPDESHGMSRNGKPWHRVYRLEKIQSFLMKELGLCRRDADGQAMA
ncbi:S9 family peptidase [Alicyclobacillus contaminans]|uniref:S9 family peptidase n=1 Tax=Alicyclobacillus contaminans TaxID=392016 RepID=UPI00055680E7|nr:S9 family peptidase [Alicyclobacillus contaminans]